MTMTTNKDYIFSRRLTSHNCSNRSYKMQKLRLGTWCFTKSSLICPPANYNMQAAEITFRLCATLENSHSLQPALILTTSRYHLRLLVGLLRGQRALNKHHILSAFGWLIICLAIGFNQHIHCETKKTNKTKQKIGNFYFGIIQWKINKFYHAETY